MKEGELGEAKMKTGTLAATVRELQQREALSRRKIYGQQL
jgi:hypothetical protein